MFDFEIIESSKDRWIVGLEVEFDKMEADMNNIKYIVKPEAGIVIGILEVNLEEYLNSMLMQMNSQHRVIAYTALQNDCPWGLEHYTIKAIARCADDDEFDEIFGKKLVEARIYKKLHRKVKLALRRAIKDMWRVAHILENEELIHGRKEDGIQRDLEEFFDVKG